MQIVNKKIILNEIQKSNPLLKNFDIKYETEKNLIYDFYFPSKKLGIIFLSLKYYSRYPLYLLETICNIKENQKINSKYSNDEILLILIKDEEDLKRDIIEIQKSCLQDNIQFFLFQNGTQFVLFLKNLCIY
jgi:hypothetical protein